MCYEVNGHISNIGSILGKGAKVQFPAQPIPRQDPRGHLLFLVPSHLRFTNRCDKSNTFSFIQNRSEQYHCCHRTNNNVCQLHLAEDLGCTHQVGL